MGFQGIVHGPPSQTGYYRASDWPYSTGVNMKAQTPSQGFTGAAQPGINLPGGWHPTIAYMFAFVIAEIIGYHVLCHFMNI